AYGLQSRPEVSAVRDSVTDIVDEWVAYGWQISPTVPDTERMQSTGPPLLYSPGSCRELVVPGVGASQPQLRAEWRGEGSAPGEQPRGGRACRAKRRPCK
ncbi:unnamed protein product, partial [Symbiodinium sp. CCMP2456]